MKKRAFTIIELVMVVVLLSIIAVIAVPLIIAVNESQLIADQRNDLSQGTRIAMDRILREARKVNNDTSIIVADSSAFQFIDTDGNNIAFSLSSNTLQRTLDGIVRGLADSVNTLAFTYYDINGTTIASPAVAPSVTDIKRIRLSLTLSATDSDLSLMSEVAPRNLNANY